MNSKKLRMPLDILMTILSIILMGGTILFPDDRIHQVMGMTLLLLWVVHIALNRRWFSSLFKGKYQPYRIMQLVVNLGVLTCALFLMISGLLMAWFIPAEWVGGSLGFARTAHLLSSHWYYIFMAFHIGLHGAMIINKIKSRYKKHRHSEIEQCHSELVSESIKSEMPKQVRHDDTLIVFVRIIFILISLYGIYAFIIRGVWKYMFGLQQFFFFDFERGYFIFALDYIAILVLFGTVSYALGKLITSRLKKED